MSDPGLYMGDQAKGAGSKPGWGESRREQEQAGRRGTGTGQGAGVKLQLQISQVKGIWEEQQGKGE